MHSPKATIGNPPCCRCRIMPSVDQRDEKWTPLRDICSGVLQENGYEKGGFLIGQKRKNFVPSAYQRHLAASNGFAASAWVLPAARLWSEGFRGDAERLQMDHRGCKMNEIFREVEGARSQKRVVQGVSEAVRRVSWTEWATLRRLTTSVHSAARMLFFFF